MNETDIEAVFSSCACLAVQKNIFDTFPCMMDMFYAKCRELKIPEEDAVKHVCAIHRSSAKADKTRLEQIRSKAIEAETYMNSNEFKSLRKQRNLLAERLKQQQEGVTQEVQQEMIALLEKMKTARSELMRERARDRYTELYKREVSRSEEGGSERIIGQIRQLEAHMNAEERAADIKAYRDRKEEIDNRIDLYGRFL